MEHRTIKARDLKVGDVLCPYGGMHFHYPIDEVKVLNNGKIMIVVKTTVQSFSPDTEFEVVSETVTVAPVSKRDDCVRCQNSASDVSHEVCVILYGKDYDTDLMLEDNDYEWEDFSYTDTGPC